MNRSRALLSNYMDGWRSRRRREAGTDTAAEEISVIAMVSFGCFRIFSLLCKLIVLISRSTLVPPSKPSPRSWVRPSARPTTSATQMKSWLVWMVGCLISLFSCISQTTFKCRISTDRSGVEEAVSVSGQNDLQETPHQRGSVRELAQLL